MRLCRRRSAGGRGWRPCSRPSGIEHGKRQKAAINLFPVLPAVPDLAPQEPGMEALMPQPKSGRWKHVTQRDGRFCAIDHDVLASKVRVEEAADC